MSELKPCPFCGGEATYGHCMTFTADGWCVKCTKCGARSVPVYENLPKLTIGGIDETTRYNTDEAKRKTAEAWNRRANDETHAPTADVAPVVHGGWAWNGKHFECTNCRHGRLHDLVLGLDAAYCPYCGAKMDLEVEG